MITLEEIDSKLIKSDSGVLPRNMIGVAVKIDDNGIGFHSALIIGVEGEYKICHYLGEEKPLVEPLPRNEWYFHKELGVLDPIESETFLSHCELAIENSDITFGYILDGSYYENGIFKTKSGLGEVCTCVGFCINIITGFLKSTPYFLYDEWDIDEENAKYFENWFISYKLKHPEVTEENFKKHYKRISPTEYSASAYFDNLPVSKVGIDQIIEHIKLVIKNKRLTV